MMTVSSESDQGDEETKILDLVVQPLPVKPTSATRKHARSEEVLDGPFASLNIRIARSKQLGRHLIAERDYQKGELIYEEHAVVISTDQPNRCGCCYLQADSNTTLCPDCQSVAWCSNVKCQQKVQRYHSGKECQLFQHLQRSGFWDRLEDIRLVYCLLRLLLLRLYEQEHAPPHRLYHYITSNMARLPEERPYLQNVWLRDIHLIVEHIPEYLLPYDNDKSPQDNLLLLAEILHINSYSLLSGGMGLFLLSSAMNHACAPNVSHINDGGISLRMIASRDIKNGEQLTTDYGTEDTDPAVVRLTRLYCERGWMCHCPRCEWAFSFGSTGMKSNYFSVLNSTVSDPNNKVRDQAAFIERSISATSCFNMNCKGLVAPVVEKSIMKSLSVDTLMQIQEALDDNLPRAHQLLVLNNVVTYLCNKCHEISDESTQNAEEAIELLTEAMNFVQTQKLRYMAGVSFGHENGRKYLELEDTFKSRFGYSDSHWILMMLRSALIDYMMVDIMAPYRSHGVVQFNNEHAGAAISVSSTFTSTEITSLIQRQLNIFDRLFQNQYHATKGFLYECLGKYHLHIHQEWRPWLQKAVDEYKGLWGDCHISRSLEQIFQTNGGSNAPG